MKLSWRPLRPPPGVSPADAPAAPAFAWTLAIRGSMAALLGVALFYESCALAAAAAIMAVGSYYDTMDRRADALDAFRVTARCLLVAVLAALAALLLLAWSLACWPFDLMPLFNQHLAAAAHRPITPLGVLLVASTAVLMAGRSLSSIGVSGDHLLRPWPPMALAVVALVGLAWGLQVWAHARAPALVPAIATAFTAAAALLLLLLAIRLSRFANSVMNNELDPHS